ncbi:hypothetical protein KOEU_05230 [Komagataeibacter europaeus]|uniref:Uncharacterized protein n=1 Tax=Komagataeibacter europaeus TaxID=33995 RepID=A0A0M0ELL7_KOMEU|nr:hypothetical protein KOEU_05230 [Komagataeibacter europaeus]
MCRKTQAVENVMPDPHCIFYIGIKNIDPKESSYLGYECH